MWTTTSFSLLILFVFFGAAYAQDSHPNDEKFINWMIESIESEDEGMITGLSGNGPSRRFMAPAQPEPVIVVIERFLGTMKQIIATRDATAIGRIFDDNFVFKGCKKSYTKIEAVRMLTLSYLEVPYSFALKSANYNNMGQIEYTVICFTSSFAMPTFEANFVYCPYRNVLKSGNRPDCPSNRRFMATAQPEPANVVIERFLGTMKQIIASRDASAIGRIFDDNFVFKGCKGSYSKAEAVKMLTTFSPESPFSFILKSANYNNQGQIEYTVTVSSHDMPAFDANFVYCPYRNVLKSGNRPNCPSSRRFMAADQPEEAIVVIERFLGTMKWIIASRNATAIEELFDENFVFMGCNRKSYTKAEVVEMITRIPLQSPYSFNLTSATYNNMGQIEYTVTVSSPNTPSFEANFVYCPYQNLLKSGNRPNCPKRTFMAAVAAPESANVVIGRFLETMKTIITTRDATAIGNIFDDNFVFKGCKKSYTKTEAVGMLTTFSPEAPFSFTLKSATYNNMGQIEYTVTVSVPTQDAFDVNFVYCPYRDLLKSGNRPNCPSSGRFMAAAPEPANVVINRFLHVLKEAVLFRDASVIGKLFDDDYQFVGCDTTYSKADAIARLSGMSPEAPLTFALKSAEWNNMGQIEYIVTISGPKPYDFDASFVYCPYRNVLKSGSIKRCPSRRRFMAAQPEPATTAIERFLGSMKQILATRDASAIGRIFDDNFVFKGCKKSYTKAEAVELLADISPESPFLFTLKSAKWNNMGQIEYTVTVSSLVMQAFDANFVYCPYRNLLKSGNRPNCPSSRMFAAAAPEPANVVINRFLESMKQIIATRDASAIGTIFDDNFVFKGCKKSYTKTEAVGMLTRFSPEAGFILKSANYNNMGQIEYTVTVFGAGPDAFDANFVYCPYRNLLKSGNRPNCPNRRMFVNQPEEAIVVINRFLESMKQALATRDATAIGKIFDDNFVFKGCKGSYSKTDVIRMLIGFSPEAPFSSTLKSANYNNMGQIEYTVTVSGAGPDAFDANFVYCPYRNLLKSGNRPNCSARRHFYEFY